MPLVEATCRVVLFYVCFLSFPEGHLLSYCLSPPNTRAFSLPFSPCWKYEGVGRLGIIPYIAGKLII